MDGNDGKVRTRQYIFERNNAMACDDKEDGWYNWRKWMAKLEKMEGDKEIGWRQGKWMTAME